MKAGKTVYLVDRVPPEYLKRSEAPPVAAPPAEPDSDA
jgi:RNA:NAD 2'-phosphotransferase (TPT1/KptA family)